MSNAMLRQASSRNGRSKSLKVKKFIQAGLLAVVTVWLVFQLKHPYREIPADDDDAASHDRMGFGGGRRGLMPRERDEPKSIDNRIEDEEGTEVDMETNLGATEVDTIDEQDGGEEAGGDSRVKTREHLQEAREKSFQGDNVASAVVPHVAPAKKDQDVTAYPSGEVVSHVSTETGTISTGSRPGTNGTGDGEVVVPSNVSSPSSAQPEIRTEGSSSSSPQLDQPGNLTMLELGNWTVGSSGDPLPQTAQVPNVDDTLRRRRSGDGTEQVHLPSGGPRPEPLGIPSEVVGDKVAASG